MQGRGTIKERKTQQNTGSGKKIKTAYMKEGKKLNEGKIMEDNGEMKEKGCVCTFWSAAACFSQAARNWRAPSRRTQTC